MRRWIYPSLILVLALAIAFLARRSGVFRSAVAEVGFSGPVRIVFDGTAQLRTQDGNVVAQEPLKFYCLPPDHTERPNECVIEWAAWDGRQKDGAEEWFRACWHIGGLPPLCMVHVPEGCGLAGAGCVASLGKAGLDISRSCRLRLRTCGAVQDAQGFWRVTPRPAWKIYLPVIFGS